MRRILQYIIICVCVIFLASQVKWSSIVRSVFFPKTIYVFMDEASFAAFQQLLYVLELPAEDTKIIHWSRLTDFRKNLEKNQENVIFTDSFEELNFMVEKYAELYPNAQFEFHFNFKHTGSNALRALAEIPRDRVSVIHMYEDSAAQLYRKEYQLCLSTEIDYCVKHILRLIRYKKQQWAYTYLNTIPHLYPIIFHTTYLEKMKQNSRYNELFKIPDIKWVNVDFEELSRKTDISVKKKLYNVFDFDIDDIQQKIKNHPMGVLFLSTSDDLFNPDINRMKMYDAIRTNMQKHKTVWFVKNHPIMDNYKPMDELYFISSRIPSEILAIAGLPVAYTAGEGTSAFFTVHGEIVAYVPCAGRHYLTTLKNFDLLNDANIYDNNKYEFTVQAEEYGE